MKLEQRYQQHQSVHNSLLRKILVSYGFLEWDPKTTGFNTFVGYDGMPITGTPRMNFFPQTLLSNLSTSTTI